ncbi:MAG: hypothetical protein GXP49_04470 [Deltaproteobacteria bacterium]|nr:hypothetical protein [Deltaproteobacteria bacterium]
MIGHLFLILFLAAAAAFAMYVHFRLIGKEPSPFEFKEEHLVRIAANVPVEGPGNKPGRRKLSRYAIALTDTRFAMFQWGKDTINIRHENRDLAQFKQSGNKLILDLRQGGTATGRPGVYMIFIDKPALWASEIRRWREMTIEPEKDEEV